LRFSARVMLSPAIVEEKTTTIVIFPDWRADLVNPGMYAMIRRR